MQNPVGTFIVLEGTDGSGKATQFRLLRERLQAVGYEVEVFDFPRYENESSYFIRRYLNGDYGPATKISPYTSSLFFALDRYEAAPDIRKALEAGKIVLSNRYVGSNMAHQGSKFDDPIERRSFFVWEDSLEFQLLGIPRPSLNLFLRVPASIAYELIGRKKARSYTDNSHDEHEKDKDHLRKSIETYDLLCELFPRDFTAIDCVQDGKLMSIPDINNRIWETIRPHLPAKPPGPAHGVTVKLDEPVPQPKQSSGSKKSKPDDSEIILETKLTFRLISQVQKSVPQTVDYDLSWAKSGYEFYTPPQLPKNAKTKYQQIMNSITSLHRQMTIQLKKSGADSDLITPTLPSAALLNAKLKLDTRQARRLINELSAAADTEAIELADKLNRTAHEQAPGMFRSAPTRLTGRQPESLHNIIARLAHDHLPQNLASQPEAVRLLDASPRNEFKVLADGIYPYSNLARREIEDELDNWDYQKKFDALSSALVSSDASLAGQLFYRFDITGDRLLIQKLEQSALVQELKTQPPTPRYGYEVPPEVEAAGIEDQYMDVFDQSLELFSSLQATGLEDLTVYGTLLGHKVRSQLSVSLQAIKDQLAKPGLSGDYKALLEGMVEKIAEVHPVSAASLSQKPHSQVASTPAKPPVRKSRSGRRGRRSGNRKTG